MFTCPHCAKALQAQHGSKGVVWICPACQGRAASVGVLRKVFGIERVGAIWNEAQGDVAEEGCACPVCYKVMEHVTWKEKDTALTLDLCRRCGFVWFDPREYEAIAPAPPKPRALGDINARDLPQTAREILALEKVKELAKGERAFGDEGPDEDWKTIPAFFGLPVEIDAIPPRHVPIATYALTALIAAVSLWTFFPHHALTNQLGLIPSEWSRLGGLTLLTSFFLHAGPVHLIGNLYFLVIFGRHVEEYLGSWRWLLVVAVSALAGDALDVACTAQSTVPLIGASGGISGLLAFYTLKFPHAKLGILFRYFLCFRWITIPAWTAFVLWIVFQLWGAYAQLNQSGDVASLAHLGGVVAGVGFWQLWKNLDTEPSAESKYPRIRIR